MDANIDPADQSQAFPTARPITERLNFAITGSGEWSAENLFIFPENVTHPTPCHNLFAAILIRIAHQNLNQYRIY